MWRLILLLALAAPLPAAAEWIYVPSKIDPNGNPFTACPYRLAREYYRTSRPTLELAQWIGSRCLELAPKRPASCSGSWANRCDQQRTRDRLREADSFAHIGYFYVTKLRRGEALPR